MITKEKLENYLKEQSTKSQIAQQENVTISTVSSWIKKYKLGYGRRSIQNCVVCNHPLCGNQTKFCSIKCHNKLNNKKYQGYSQQRQRGVEKKLKLIALRGSKCEYCGYNKNLASLQFHHIDPNEKDDQMDMRKLANSKIEWCLKELSKCKVLCANCHAEEHHPHLNLENLVLPS